MEPTTPVSETIVSAFEKPKPRKKFIVALFTVLGILIIAGTALGYSSGYFVSLDDVVSDSVKASKEMKSASFDMSMTIDASGMKKEGDTLAMIPGISDTFIFGMKGSYDSTDTANPKLTSTVSMASGSFEFGLDLRIINQSIYAMLTKAPNLPFLPLESYKNKWVAFPYGSLIKDEDPRDFLMKLYGGPFGTMTDEQKKQIEDIVDKASLIRITKRHLPETIDGTLSFHFDFDLDKAGIIAYIKEVNEYLKTINTDMKEMPPIDDAEFSKVFEAVKDFKGEAWIGVSDHLLRKAMVSMAIEDPTDSDMGEMKIAMTMLYSDWGKQVSVEVPSNTTTLEKLMSSSMNMSAGMMDPSFFESSSMGSVSADAYARAEIAGNDAAIKSIHSSMRAQAELYFDHSNGSYSGFCKAKDNYGPGSLTSMLPPGTLYKCNDSSNKWASWSKLSDGMYWCVDSSGFSGDIGSTPPDPKSGGTACTLEGFLR